MDHCHAVNLDLYGPWLLDYAIKEFIVEDNRKALTRCALVVLLYLTFLAWRQACNLPIIDPVPEPIFLHRHIEQPMFESGGTVTA